MPPPALPSILLAPPVAMILLPATVELLAKTDQTVASIREADIADLHGGSRPTSYQPVVSEQGLVTDRPICTERSMSICVKPALRSTR